MDIVYQLTDNAVDDYNRARTYLADLANRDGVPVLNDVDEAVNCAVKLLKDSKELDWSTPPCKVRLK